MSSPRTDFLEQDQQRVLSALAIFLLAQLVGTFLRALPLLPLKVNYTYVLYGHTHVALTGWVQSVLYLALMRLLPAERRQRPVYSWIWRLNLGCTLGMLFSFPVQGYKAISIILSSAVILVSYAFAWNLWRDSRLLANTPAWRSIRLGLVFLLLSSLGPWSLGFLMVKFPGSHWIQLAVYFYLHFFYNGFFSLVLLGLFLDWGASKTGYQADFWPLGLLAAACVPAYALSALWVNPPAWVWGLAWLAAGMQLFALAGLLAPAKKIWQGLELKGWPRLLLGISLLSFGLKLGLQAVSSLPGVALALGANRYLIIGYLHLVFLGFITCFLLAWLLGEGLLKASGWALSLLLSGMAGSELLLFSAGALAWFGWGSLPAYSLSLFLASLLMPLGTAWLIVQQLISTQHRCQLPIQQ